MIDEAAMTETTTTDEAPAPTDTGAAAADGGAPAVGSELDEGTVLSGEDKPAADGEADQSKVAGEGAEGGEDKAPALTGAPEAYELIAPEGMTLDPKAIELAAPVFKELNLSNEGAQKLLPVAAKWAEQIKTDGEQRLLTSVVAERKAWVETARKDPEMGGAKWEETVSLAAKGLDQLGFPKGTPFRVLLDESGLGNHPDMIRAWRKVGQLVSEDSFERADAGAAVKKSDADLFYPGMTKPS